MHLVYKCTIGSKSFVFFLSWAAQPASCALQNPRGSGQTRHLAMQQLWCVTRKCICHKAEANLFVFFKRRGGNSVGRKMHVRLTTPHTRGCSDTGAVAHNRISFNVTVTDSVSYCKKAYRLKNSKLLGQTNFSDASASFVCPFPSGEVGMQCKIMSQGVTEPISC